MQLSSAAPFLAASFFFCEFAMGQLHVVDLPKPGEASTQTILASNNDGPREPYLLSPGHYVLPAPYSPTNWSPHIRPFPDYSTLRQPSGALRNRSFGANDSGYPLGYGPNGPVLGYGCSSGYGYSSGDSYFGGGDVSSAYNQGRYDAQHEYLWYIASQRAGRLLNQSAAQFDEGVRFYHEGQYDKALVNWLGAAELNHDSAAPRLHAAHAMFAMGRYDEATPMLSRAFELMPSLAYKTYDIRDEYGSREDFDSHLATLEHFVVHHPSNAAAMTLLGYVTYYSAGPSAAQPILRRAERLDPKSYFIPKLLSVSSKTGVVSGHKPSNTKPSSRKKSMHENSVSGARLARANIAP